MGTPQQLVNKTGSVVWKAKALSFGETSVEVDTVANNLRFPGQYFDAETGTHYNYFRDYEPGTGRYVQSDPIGMLGGLNAYGYVDGDPVGFVDPYGLYAGVDDLIAAGIGAGVGIIGQGIGDLISWELSGFEDYTGAAVGGAAGGVAFLYSGPIGAGLVGGAITNATKQVLKNLTDKQCGFSGQSFLFDASMGAITGFVPGIPVKGINSGRGSWQHVSNRVMTQLDQGSISNVSNKTLSKMFGVNLWNGAGGIGAGFVAATGSEKIGLGSDCTCKVNP